ncbi:hypothetical protein [Micromonospora thermarum]|uniref:Uncharacterized protein n=1 Tax=Micromonospora thermarum TaxID=2720024 RepID=A0ABX0Z8T8_9ACTN|nr:hypothetical protein [Micromonospora thermarum]NJP32824.1 hypothetical protein [Micromonospora thermarum]
MAAHIHHHQTPYVPLGTPGRSAGQPVTAPVFVDVTGRRHRLVRLCGLLVAAGSLVYIPLVATAVLPGPAAPYGGSAPADGRSFLAAADQPSVPPGEADVLLDPLDAPPAETAPVVETEPPGRPPAPVDAPVDRGPDPAPPPPAPQAMPTPGGPATVPPTNPEPAPPPSPSPTGTPPSPSPSPPATDLLDPVGRWPA